MPTRDTMAGKVAVVTGGGRGLGAAIAERLREEDMKVITLDLADADHAVDVRDEARLRAVAAELGHVDVLVNSAGIVGPSKLLTETTDTEWRNVYDVNVFGTVNTMRTFIPGMVERGWGRVVNISSIVGKDGSPTLSIYASSKAAIIALTKSVGKELATSGVMVNVVAPAVIDTPMNSDTDPDYLSYVTSLIPMRRTGKAHEVAELVAFLATDRVSFSTGAVYDISGGRATH